ncbi:uncharacterized protein A4U43_C04F12310 [Asparagus officinalis]|uniref:Fungal lipase-like domain-containing protein n=1 Tax=Asparagus officinalis TaxID=4686 RepID=A0A5P1F5M6_ASPOF|nr:uncharacterized protein LOC109837144 [Asparagus officinalis]ONK71780.1 uncharacterized protein A4U43_C04F12310 [Asparagus officinalis]
MSILCGIPVLESVYCLICARWAYKRCLHSAGHESEYWPVASTIEFDPVPRLCRAILSIKEPMVDHGLNPQWVISRKSYKDTKGRAPPYLIYLDHDNADVVLALRGLNLARESDYAVLLDNKLGRKKFNGGYVHNGLLKAAVSVLESESEVLRKLLEENPKYMLTFAGHSLGSGVAAMLAMVVVENMDKLGIEERKRVRCYAIAPARCMSLNLAVKYADVINSVVLQDDFLPRTSTPLEDIFKSIFCLPCLLCLRCMRDTFIPEERLLRDPRRLYAPGRLYHIVERKLFRCGRYPPVVRTAVPVDGRLEHIVLSCNATKDHEIVWIEKEAQRALDLMHKEEYTMNIPPVQKMERQKTLARDHSEQHRAALRRAITLAVPDAFSSSEYGTFHETYSYNGSSESSPMLLKNSRKSASSNWDELLIHYFDKDGSGKVVFQPSSSGNDS